MDGIFKELYADYIFSLLPFFKLSWIEQVKQLNKLWDTAGNMINKSKFCKSFTCRCSELLLRSHAYNFDIAFKNANMSWRFEIMTSVANHIIVFWNHCAPLRAKPAKWNGIDFETDATQFDN